MHVRQTPLYFHLIHVGGMAFANAKYGGGSGPIHLTNVLCTSSMSILLQCSYSDPVSSCTHFADAGVQCEGLQDVHHLRPVLALCYIVPIHSFFCSSMC